MVAEKQNLITNDLLIMAKAHNYHNWLLNQFSGFIGNRVLDLGAGVGTYTEILADKQLVVAVDREIDCIKYLKKKFINYENIFVVQLDIQSKDILTLKDLSLDTIVCLNVLEHLQDDVITLKRLNFILNQGGRLLLVVPAHQMLYGSIDKTVGHYRRYSKKELFTKLFHSGFIVEKLAYMNSLAVFGWFVVNRILKKQEQSIKTITTYDKYVIPVLSKLESFIPPPLGLSLVARASKAS